MKNLLLIISILIISFSSKAHDKDTSKVSNFKHEVGFHAGSTSGYGPSYRVWYKKIGLQVTLLPYFMNYEKSNKNSSLVYGLSLNYKLQQNKFVDLYGFANFSSNMSKQVYYPNDPTWSVETNKSIKSNIGLGVGFNFKITPEFILSTQIGYGLYQIEKLYQGNIAGGLSLLYKL
jgi:thioredoxin-related protein